MLIQFKAEKLKMFICVKCENSTRKISFTKQIYKLIVNFYFFEGSFYRKKTKIQYYNL